MLKHSPPCWQFDSTLILHQQGNGLHIITLVEVRLEDGIVDEIAETEQLKGAELMVVAQAEFQTVVAVGSSRGFASLRNVFGHLIKWHGQQALHTFTL